jgi:hypothetical protein
MPKGKKITGLSKNAAEWKKLIEEWLNSKESITKFCNERRLVHASFYYWRAKFDPHYKLKPCKEKRIILDPQKITFAEVKIEPKKSICKAVLHYPNGCFIEFSEAFSPELLQLFNQAMGLNVC